MHEASGAHALQMGAPRLQVQKDGHPFASCGLPLGTQVGLGRVGLLPRDSWHSLGDVLDMQGDPRVLGPPSVGVAQIGLPVALLQPAAAGVGRPHQQPPAAGAAASAAHLGAGDASPGLSAPAYPTELAETTSTARMVR